MAQNPSALKRQKEHARAEKQRDKEAKRRQRKLEKQERGKDDPAGGDVVQNEGEVTNPTGAPAAAAIAPN